jgi:hypothetical protein
LPYWGDILVFQKPYLFCNSWIKGFPSPANLLIKREAVMVSERQHWYDMGCGGAELALQNPWARTFEIGTQ